MHESVAHMMYGKALNEIKLFSIDNMNIFNFSNKRKIILNIIKITPALILSISFHPFCSEVKIVKVNFKTV